MRFILNPPAWHLIYKTTNNVIIGQEKLNTIMHTDLVLVINCGSSSLKFALYHTHQTKLHSEQTKRHSEQIPTSHQQKILAEGLAESLNQDTAKIQIKCNGEKQQFELKVSDVDENSHTIALQYILQSLEEKFNLKQNLIGIGHRVVHGGNLFKYSTQVDDHVLDQIKACTPLAPLHNPANISGIETLQNAYPKTPQVAVFDTAFHQSMPAKAFTYALPYALYKNEHVRRYGFHGISHRYMTIQAAHHFDKSTSDINIVTAHLGNGASVSAIKNGLSVDTSMGMTPLEGLVMGTRCGDLDPGIFDYLISKDYSPAQISNMLNKQSGLLGISGISNDMRTICEQAEKGHEAAQLALDVFCFRAAKHIAAMTVSLSSIDAIIFTGGIGENSPQVRHQITEQLGLLGFSIDANLNKALKAVDDKKPGSEIQSESSRPILVIPTDEESLIVQDTLDIIHSA